MGRLLLLIAALTCHTAASVPLRAPGSSTNDGYIFVGGLGINGNSTYHSQFDPLFQTYLNNALGASLNVTFVNVYLDFTTTYTAVQNNQLDFIYTNPSIFSCLQTQNAINAIASIQSLRPTATPPYTSAPQSVFGGNFFALASRTDINHIEDIAGKRLEGADVTGLGAGQAQWREFVARNMSFWNVPSVMIFSHNQNGIALDVFNGYADVGMVRTDLLESLQVPSCVNTSTITCFPPGTFKILDPKPASVLPPGFPFNSSTVVYPEWPVSALPHVSQAVQKAVAQALYALDSSTGSATRNYTTAAKISTFTTPLEYADLRTMQESLGWIVNGSCITSTQTYDTIVCSPGTFKLSQAVLNTTCAPLNLTCKAGYDCTCSPCAPLPPRPLAVTLTASNSMGQAAGLAPLPAGLSTGNSSASCVKLVACGSPVAQGTTFTATLTDNLFGYARTALGLSPVGVVSFLWHDPAVNGNLTQVNATAMGNGVWSVNLTALTLGTQLLEVFTDGSALDQNPLLVSIVPPVCPSAFARPNSVGVCQCLPGYSLAADRVTCNSQSKSSISVPGAVAGSVCGAAVLVALLVGVAAYTRRRADSKWRIPMKEIQFADPPEILGRGTFGLVIKGTYRGTVVALKRTLPPQRATGSSRLEAGTVHASSSMMSGVKPFDLPFKEPRSVSSMSNRSSTVSNQRTSAAHLSGRLAASGSTLEAVTVVPPSAIASGQGTQPVASVSDSSGSSFLGFAMLKKQRKMARLRADFAEEMRLVVHLRHPCITTVLGAVLERGSEPLLVMEHMERGSLYDLLHNETVPLDADMILPIVNDVVSGMAFLHAANPPILHNDLKAGNVLVDSNFRAKVSDFGLSGKSRATGGQPGTPLWMAPELLRQQSRTTPATDVYAFGITLAEVFTRNDPYADQAGDVNSILSAVAHPKPGQPLMRPSLGTSVPPVFVKLMQRCWSEDASSRPSMKDISSELQLYLEAEKDTAGVTTALAAAKASVLQDRALLNQVFPPAVAAALAAGRRVEPQQYDCVTVFFADVCGFTELAARMQPLAVANMLDRLYTVFDDLVMKHGIYKMETIGDAFMESAVGNIFQQDADHCARVAAFAMDVVAAAPTVLVDPSDPAAGSVHVRAGLHCGPVVATVVGTANPRFCLFGDTVNTASRMESNSAPDRVNLSEEAATLLNAQCPGVKTQSRGVVQVKGKGAQVLHWLVQGPPVSMQAWLNAEQPRQGGSKRVSQPHVSQDLASSQ